jgi:hypothetical protein
VFEHRNSHGVLLQERSVEEKAKFHYYMAKTYAKAGMHDRALLYIRKALEEGISFIEGLEPSEAVADEYGKLAAVRFQRAGSGEIVELPARTCLVAAGTTPNITYAKEFPEALPLDQKRRFFAPHHARRDGAGWRLEPAHAEDESAFFTGFSRGGKLITFFGDNHPAYNGNVVKAMASAKHGFPQVTGLFARELAALDPAGQAGRDAAWKRLTARLDEELVARVVEVVRLTPTIIEVIVKAPAPARHFEPGQFYRLQNFESMARRAGEVPLLMEGIALTGAWVDKERGLLSLIALVLARTAQLTWRWTRVGTVLWVTVYLVAVGLDLAPDITALHAEARDRYRQERAVDARLFEPEERFFYQRKMDQTLSQ